MLNAEIMQKIEQFVSAKPRSIQEIASHLDKNWRTADRYIEEMEKNFGTISTRVFRGGTRGALKIAYWSAIDKISSNVFQEKIEQEILNLKRKESFSAFDIYQHVPAKDKKVTIAYESEEFGPNLKELSELVLNTTKQLLLFSGNLSFINLKNKEIDMFAAFESLIKRGIPIKVLCRIDIVGRENIEKMLSLNFKYGRELIEIRHAEHPIRAIISDNKAFRIKEIKEPTGKLHELKNKVFIFYTIKNKDWSEWLSKIFWKMFSSSLTAQRRIEEMQKISLR
ncbi:MAG TPA: hypothetical protein VI544_00385 [Candidatus Nanoarchaeia archaeon]|nr:hypothetical protein [Candidatus Nanoarchaeia archaeon]